jgi:hypothetical protein
MTAISMISKPDVVKIAYFVPVIGKRENRYIVFPLNYWDITFGVMNFCLLHDFQGTLQFGSSEIQAPL